MQPQFHNQDSKSILDYLIPTKSQRMAQKKQTKQKQQIQRHRKNSTQLSLFGWLAKSRPTQNSQLARLSKNLILQIFGFLRVAEITAVASTCFSFFQCARGIWCDQEFFRELQTDKFSQDELRSVLQRGGKMGHVRQLRNIYMGKNLKACRIKVKVHDTTSLIMKPATGNLLEVFEVSPKTHKSSAFLMDNHLQEIINSSFRSLTIIKLQACRFIRKFYDISKCHQLITLTITSNPSLTNEDLKTLSKNCPKITNLDLSDCECLDQGLFKIIARWTNLETLNLRGYSQPFGDLDGMEKLTELLDLGLENSCVLDGEALGLMAKLPGLRQLDLVGCQLLTDVFLFGLMAKKRKLELKLGRNGFSAETFQKWEIFAQGNKKQEQLKNSN